MPNDTAQKIIDLLSPSLGAIVAKSYVTVACNKTGKDLETLSKGDLSAVASKIESGLSIRLGPAAAKRVAEQIMRI